MKCYAQFCCPGYSSPLPNDYEEFSRLADVKLELWKRFNFNPKFPLVNEEAEFKVWFGKPEDDFPCDLEPDATVYFGPRLGINVERYMTTHASYQLWKRSAVDYGRNCNGIL